MWIVLIIIGTIAVLVFVERVLERVSCPPMEDEDVPQWHNPMRWDARIAEHIRTQRIELRATRRGK